MGNGTTAPLTVLHGSVAASSRFSVRRTCDSFSTHLRVKTRVPVLLVSVRPSTSETTYLGFFTISCDGIGNGRLRGESKPINVSGRVVAASPVSRVASRCRQTERLVPRRRERTRSGAVYAAAAATGSLMHRGKNPMCTVRLI